MLKRIKKVLSAGFVLGFVVLNVAAMDVAAQEFPNRQMTFLVPYAPGGGTDVYARLIADGIREKFKQTVVVENRPGAAGQIAASALVNSPADGHTLMMAGGTQLVTTPLLYNKLSYQVDDLAPVALIGFSVFVLVANPSVPAKTLAELIAYIKSQPPGTLSYGSPGVGSPHHLFMEMFLSRIGAKMIQVPYKGSTPALTDVVAGNIPMMMVDLTPAQQLIAEGKVTAFGITSPERAKSAPTLPTIQEAGLPDYSAVAWNAIVTRRGTPAPVIEQLNRTIADFIKRPDINRKVYLSGIEPTTTTVAEFSAFLAKERSKWSKAISEAGIPKGN